MTLSGMKQSPPTGKSPFTLLGEVSQDSVDHDAMVVSSPQKTLRRVAGRQAAVDGSRINLEDIPRLTDEQLANMIRLRDARPRKVAVSVRLDARVLSWLKSKGDGHLTRINDILTNLMEAEQRARQGR